MENLSQELEFLDFGGLSESEICSLQDVLSLNLPAPPTEDVRTPDHSQQPDQEDDSTISTENDEIVYHQESAADAGSGGAGGGIQIPQNLEGMGIPVTMAYPASMPPTVQMYNPNLTPTSMPHFHSQPAMVNYVPLISGTHPAFGPGPNFYVNNMTANVNVNNSGTPYLQHHRMSGPQPVQYMRKKPGRAKFPIKKDGGIAMHNGHMGHPPEGYSNVSVYPHGSYMPCFPGSLVQAATGVPIVMHQPYMHRSIHVPVSGGGNAGPPIYPTVTMATTVVPVVEAPVQEYVVPVPVPVPVPVQEPIVVEAQASEVQEVETEHISSIAEVVAVQVNDVSSSPVAEPPEVVETIEAFETEKTNSPPPVSTTDTSTVSLPLAPEISMKDEANPLEHQTSTAHAAPAVSTVATTSSPSATSAPKSWASLFKNAAVSTISTEKPTARVEPFSPLGDKKTETTGPSVRPVVDDARRQLAKHLAEYEMLLTPLALLPRGLTNKNNWCYINATLQALIACPPFVHLIKSLGQFIGNRSGQSQTPIIDSVIEFVNQFETVPIRSHKDRAAAKKEDPHFGTSFEPSSMYKMLSKIRSETFKVEGRQEDAEEFLSCLLNGLHDEMIEVMKFSEDEGAADQVGGLGETRPNPTTDEEDWQVIGPKNRGCVTRTTTYSKTPISNLFLGLMRSALHHAGAQSTATLQPFFSLQLDIQNEKVNSVREALECLVSKEPLTGYVCSKTGQEVEASRQTTLEELPPILILHLKCFVYDKSGGCQKLLKRVDFTADLDLSKDLLSPAQKGKVKEKQRHYKLFAVVYHDGKEATKGHYVTEVKHDGVGQWLRFDDSIVRTVGDGQLFKYNLPRMPYLLMYRRADTFSASAPRPAGGNSSSPNTVGSGNTSGHSSGRK